MCGIGLYARQLSPSGVVEAIDQVGIPLERLWRGQGHRVVVFPQATGIAEGGEARLRRHTGAGQHDNSFNMSAVEKRQFLLL